MSDTTFQNGVTLTDDDWFNDINDFYYTTFGEAGSLASAQAAFYSATVAAAASFTNVNVTGTLSVSAASVFGSVSAGYSVISNLQVPGIFSISAGVAGAAVATQANMESAASAGSTAMIVTPGRLQYHPGVAKAWVRFDGSTASVTAAGAYNVTSITDNGSGNYTVAWITPFSSSNYAVDVASSLNNSRLVSISSTNAQVILLDLSGTAADATIVSLIAYGDQ